MDIYIRWNCNPFLSCQQYVRKSPPLWSPRQLRLMHWIWLWAGECNQCRQAPWMTQTWEYFWCWILCVFWLSVWVKFTWWVKSVCHFLLWWNAFWHYECWLSLCTDDGACSSSLGRGGGYRLTFCIMKDLPFGIGPLFLSSFFVVSWKTWICGHWRLKPVGRGRELL